VLLLETGGEAGRGVLQALAAKQPLGPLVRRLPDGVFVAKLGREADDSLWQLLARVDLWRDLRERFADIAIDLPSPAASRLGMAIAPSCDGVVVVLEAEKTRVPVATNLVANLRAVRANVLGTVLNKRRFHLPARIYRWL
jgi:Mrp family chromosome partitioning ATPase